MHSRLLSLAAALWLCAASATVHSQDTSILRLERPMPASCPFQKGDQLEIRDGQSESSASTRVTVIEVKNWPWIYVKSADGEVWINFGRVYSARYVVGAR
jgi:hypothetical protein